jgi:hypothetical protein
MLRDFEEIIAVENWAKRTESMIHNKKNWMKKEAIWMFWNVNSHGFAKRDVFIFIIMSIITILKVQFLESSWSSVLFISILVFVLLP